MNNLHAQGGGIEGESSRASDKTTELQMLVELLCRFSMFISGFRQYVPHSQYMLNTNYDVFVHSYIGLHHKVMDVLTVVIHLRDLASEPQNRETIVKDQGCVPGLVLFLTHHNLQVSFCALQALRYLAECPSNREIMKNELGMMVCLENLYESDHALEGTRILAAEIYDLLKKPLHADSLNMETKKELQTQFFISNTNKKAKTVILQIEGLYNMDHRSICEEALLKVKGVISFTFQMTLQRCIIRICSDLQTECLASAIAATKVLQAHQVVKNESGEEMVVPLNSQNAKVEEKHVDLPDYLPEDESVKNDQKAVSQTGTKCNTVTWLNAAANFLTKTFYW